MNHDLLRILATGAIFLLVLFLPVLWILYTDWFRQRPSPQHFATLFVIVAVAGVLLFLPALTIVAAAALLAFGVAWLSARYALSGVHYSRTLSPARLFAGDQADLAIRLENRKILPLASLSLVDHLHWSTVRADRNLDELIRFSGGIEVQEELGYALVNRTAVGPFQELIRTYRITGIHRGVFSLGPAEISTGDPFGLFRKETTLGGRLEIVVYPRIYSQEEIGLPFREALGEMLTRRALFEDPTLIAGSREYRPGDPLRRMHWKATARTDALQVRVSDPSTTAQLMIVLNMNTFQHVWEGVDPERMEAAISVAASVAAWALGRDFATGLRTNGVLPGAEQTPRVAPSANPQQTVLLLEHLARIAFSGRFSPEHVLLDEVRRLGENGSIIFVTPLITPPLIRVLSSPRLRGRVSIVYCGRFAAPVVPGLTIHLAVPPMEAQRAVS